MDVERTMQFILDQQAKAEERWQKSEARWQKSEERWQRAEERMGSLEKRQEKFDKSLVGVRKLIVAGMKMVSRVAASQKLAQAELREIRDDIRGLTAAQKRADEKFERLVELMSRRSPNGRH
jgi:chromosome segregation ATPase